MIWSRVDTMTGLWELLNHFTLVNIAFNRQTILRLIINFIIWVGKELISLDKMLSNYYKFLSPSVNPFQLRFVIVL